jgi:uncharacterized repeat protein (TIGR01451 family)
MPNSTIDPVPPPAPHDDPDPVIGPGRVRLFVLLAVVCLLAGAGYVGWAALRASGGDETTAPVRLAAGIPALMFQNLTDGNGDGQVGIVPLDRPAGPRTLTGLSCDRVHFASGRGLCLSTGASFPPVEYALVFGADFTVTHEIPLNGLPSRARVSPDGRFGAATVFVAGHSYAEAGFSTVTTIIDMAAGTVVANLESFTILQDGRPYTAADINFWGVTFDADSNRFFATLATGGRTYLVEGDVAGRRLTMGHENVECPSLSPDGTRIAYKKRVDNGSGSPVWRFQVLDLATGGETPLAEARSVDDQIEWLDDRHVLYGSPDPTRAVFVLPADGSGVPRKHLGEALSPVVLRAGLPDDGAAGLAAAPQVSLPTTDLAVQVAAPVRIAQGESLVHTITVTNRGSQDATRVVAEDVVSGAVTISGATAGIPPGAGSYGCAVYAEEKRVGCDVPVLRAGASWTITVVLRPDSPGAVEGRVFAGAADQSASSDDVASVHSEVDTP